MLFKATINWLFNDMRCYLVVPYLIGKLTFPPPPPPPPKKKKVVRVYCILKHCGLLLDIIMQNIVYDY